MSIYGIKGHTIGCQWQISTDKIFFLSNATGKKRKIERTNVMSQVQKATSGAGH